MNYKCTHNYPGGPDVGYISEPHKVQPETDENCHYYNHNWFDPKLYPKFWEKVREPIFTTEDGIGLFEGDKYYAVYSTWLYDSFSVSKSSPLSHTKNFSSRELADKYIEENKPQYSKKDMIAFGYKVANECTCEVEVNKCFERYIKK